MAISCEYCGITKHSLLRICVEKVIFTVLCPVVSVGWLYLNNGAFTPRRPTSTGSFDTSATGKKHWSFQLGVTCLVHRTITFLISRTVKPRVDISRASALFCFERSYVAPHSRCLHYNVWAELNGRNVNRASCCIYLGDSRYLSDCEIWFHWTFIF